MDGRTHVEGGDGAGGLAGDELHLEVELAEEVPLLGLQPRARRLVQGQLHGPPTVAESRIARAPHHVEVPLEVVVAACHRLRRRRQGQGDGEDGDGQQPACSATRSAHAWNAAAAAGRNRPVQA